MSAVNKSEIFEKFGGKATNTGSIEAQVALFTSRINHISDHLKDNRKDHSSRRALLKLVGKRRRSLDYLAKSDLEGYRKLIADLGIRK